MPKLVNKDAEKILKRAVRDIKKLMQDLETNMQLIDPSFILRSSEIEELAKTAIFEIRDLTGYQRYWQSETRLGKDYYEPNK